MARKFLVPTPGYDDPASGYQTLNAGNSAKWGAPDSGVKAFDALNEWSGPELGIRLGDLPVSTYNQTTLIKYLTLFGERIVWYVIGHDLETMQAPDGSPLLNSTTLFTEKVIAILCFDAVEPTNTDSRCKDTGNSDWSVSNLRQWANSSASPGNWYSAQHKYDAPPDTAKHCCGYNPYLDYSGMLYESSEKEIGLLLETKRNYSGSNAAGGSSVDRIFVPTCKELNDRNGKGSQYENYSDGIVIPNIGCVATSTNTEATKASLEHSDYKQATVYYWTATRNYSDSILMSSSSYGAYSGFGGFRPMCNLSSDTLVSAKPDADGCYTLII